MATLACEDGGCCSAALDGSGSAAALDGSGSTAALDGSGSTAALDGSGSEAALDGSGSAALDGTAALDGSGSEPPRGRRKLTELPAELLEVILCSPLLDHVDVCRASCACRRLRDACHGRSQVWGCQYSLR